MWGVSPNELTNIRSAPGGSGSRHLSAQRDGRPGQGDAYTPDTNSLSDVIGSPNINLVEPGGWEGLDPGVS